MRKYLLPLLIALLLAAAACRRGEETPTPTQPPTRAATATQPAPTATARPATPEAPAATPEGELDLGRIDPDDIDWAPQVIASSPLPGEETLLDGAITIKFDQPMDQDSVEDAFTIEPAGGREPVEGAFSWPQPDTVVFTPASLERAQNYRVLIGARAAGRNGQRMEEPVQLLFQTTGFLEVAQTIPAADSSNIGVDASITVLFNRPVVPLVSTGQQAGLPQPLEIEPPVEGRGEWISTSIYRFTPDEGFQGATTYEVTIPAGLEDVTGAVLEEPVSWSFTTLQPSVAETTPANGDFDVAPTTAITVTFNMDMDRASTEAAISLQPSHPLSFSWQDDRTVVVTPEEMLALGANYTLTVGAQARAASGRATLDATTSSSFTTVPLPRVTRTFPGSGQLADYYDYGVSIEFSAPIDPDTIEGRIQINPAPADFDYFVSGKYVNLDFPLARETQYEVTIPADVADPYGNTLGSPYTWQFTTPAELPVVSLNLPLYISQLPAAPPNTVDIVYRNVTTINAVLYDLGLPVTLLTEPYRAQEMSAPGPALREWNLPVEAPHNVAQFTTLDLGDISSGVYLLYASSPQLPDRYWQNQRNVVVIGDTNIVVKEMFGAVHVWVTDLNSGAPAAGRNLTLYDINGTEIGTATSDSSGFASFSYQPPGDYLPGVVVVSEQPGEAGFGVGSSTWSGDVSPWMFDVSVTSSDEADEFAYIYTDRPIYRPGDTVHYRGIVRQPNYARYGLPERDQITVRAEYVSFFEPSEQLSYEVTLPLDEYGAFSGEYVIPEDASLGTYQLFLPIEGPSTGNTRMFTVAEYRRPEFAVTVTPDMTQTVRGGEVDVVVEARYFFGAPASDLELFWTVYELPYHLPWDSTPYYSFTTEDFFYYFPSEMDSAGYYGNYVTQGGGRTDADGRFVITLPADLLAEVEAGSRKLTVEATIRDLGEFPITGRTEIIFHAADLYVGTAPAGYLNEAGEETAVQLITVDWDREPVANQTVEVVFYEREYERIEETRPGFGDRWEPVDTEVARTQVQTDADGEAVASFVPPAGGTYRAVSTVTDAAGRSHSSSTIFWVTDRDFVGWPVNTDAKRMELTTDQPIYAAGDTASVLVQSPFPGPVNAWLTIERGTLIEQRLITLQSNSEVVEIPVTDAFAPNVFVTIVAVQAAGEEQIADIRMGLVELIVPPDQFALDVTLTPQADVFGPGDTASYEIRVTDAMGQPVEASVSLALVDLAVLTLQEDNAPHILDAFYERQPYRSVIGAGLFVSGEGLPIDVPEEVLGRGGGGGGGPELGLDAGALVEDQEEGLDVRRNFPDTAFWRASVTTDAGGAATVEIPLPDTLTTWRLSAKAVTTDTEVGQSSVDIITTLPLLLRPVTPRFFTVNDVVQIGAVVNNNTGQPLDVTVSLEAEGVTVDGESSQEVSVPAGRQQLVRWTVTVLDVEAVDLTFRAEGGGFRDATKPSFGEGPDQLIPVYRYDAEDLVGTSGVLDDAGQRVEAFLLPPAVNQRQGSVDVQVTASLAGAILQGLEYVNSSEVDDFCAHGVVSRFLPNLAILRAFRDLGLEPPQSDVDVDELVTRSIRALDALEKAGGGWGWCYSPQVDPYLTAYVLYGLYHAAAEGYSLEGIDAQAALRRLNIREAGELGSAWEVNRQAWFLYVLSLWDAAELADLDALFFAQRELLDPYARAYLALAYTEIDRGNENVESLLSDLADEAVLSATGAHWEQNAEDWRNLSSDIRGTAVVIDALAQLDADHAIAPNAVRWLMAARQAAHWKTPFETTWSLIALTDWMVATGELDAEFSYEIRANAAQLGEGSFAGEEAIRVDSYSVPLSAVPADETNYLIFERSDGPGRLYYTTHMDAFIDAETVEPVNRGFTVTRNYFDAECDPEAETCEPLTAIEAGQRVRVELTIVTPNDRTFVRVVDPIPAGTEAVDPGLATSASGLGGTVDRTDRDYRSGYWGWWFFNRIEYRDDRVVFLSNFLLAGTYQYSYFLETPIPGSYQVRPAVAYEDFFPEVFGRSAGLGFTVEE